MSDEKCFTVTWDIENFSIYSGADCQELKSVFWNITTDMIAGDFRLGVHVKALQVIFRLYDASGATPVAMHTNCEMSLISSCGTIPLKKEVFGYFSINRNDIFCDKKYIVLPSDTLTVCCKILNVCRNIRDLRFCSVLHRMNFPWTIENFLHNETFHETAWIKDEFKIQIMIVSNVKLQNRYMVTATGMFTRGGSYSILDFRFSSKQDSGYFIKTANNSPNNCIWNTDFDIIKLRNTGRNLRLQFECIVAVNKDNTPTTSFLKSIKTSSACLTSEGDKTRTPSGVKTNSPAVAVQDPGTLTNDLLSILRDTTLSDATLNTEGKSFSAHKIILAARSSVFKAMFEKEDTTESRSGIVDIEDIESDTVQRFLVFLYSESLEDVQWDDASKLYYAADKYAVLLLKQKCCNILKAGLSVSNACDAIVLADRHSDDELMKCAVDFVRDHQEVISSSDWEELEESDSRLAAKILRQVFVKKGKN